MNDKIHSLVLVGLIIAAGTMFATSCLREVEEWSPFPDIRFKTTEYDFGEIDQGQIVECTYEFKNGGEDTLRISKVRKGCGCQSAEASREVIPPGETGEIRVTFDSKGYNGNVRKQVYVHSNDPEEERAVLSMTGKVLVDFVIRPKSLNFLDVTAGASKSKKLYLVAKAMDRLEVKDIEVSADFITVSQAEYVEDGKKGVELEVTLGPEAPARTVMENIQITTNSKRQPTVKIQVYARVSNDVTLSPKTINVKAKAGETRPYELSVFKGDRKEFRITGIDEDNKYIEAAIRFMREKEDRQSYEITLHVLPGAPRGILKGSLILKTNDPDQRDMLLRLGGVIE